MSSNTISGFKIVRLSEMLQYLGEERVNTILSSFSSPLNEDVEDFLIHKAVTFDKQSISRSFLVFTSYKKTVVLIGYYTIANKIFTISAKKISNTLRKRIGKFGEYDNTTKTYTLSAPLIAQLSKNFTNGYNKLITGDELLDLACQEVKRIQLSIGGKAVFLECEDKPKLLAFYNNNNFKQFSERQLDEKSDNKKLLQLIRIL